METIVNVLVSYMEKMLMEMTKKEVYMLLGVYGDINKMSEKLGDLKNFLADADRRNIIDRSVQAWVRELRGATYDAANILDLCQLKAMDPGPSKKIGCFHPLLFCMRNPLHAHSIGTRIKKFNQRLDEIKARGTSLNVKNLGSFESPGTNLPFACPRGTAGALVVSDLVGEKIEDGTRNLLDMLTKEQSHQKYNKIMVFAIVGVGGVGKTTLAQKIFTNHIIQQEFTKKIWLSVNKNSNDTELLTSAIIEAGGVHPVTGTSNATLMKDLIMILKGHKTLLIMDDVWECNHIWGTVFKPILFSAALAHGSRVLVTTRHLMVARGMMAEEPYHHVDKLEPEDAWLLLKKLQGNDDLHVDTLKDIGMAIIEKCDCLPLAVKIMGGLLRQKGTRREIWRSVLNESIWSVPHMPNNKQLIYALYLSYEDLDPSLKFCFLHYSLLPKSTVFSVNEIVGMWISEGFIQEGNSGDLEEIGKQHYRELIERNLLEPNTRFTEQSACTMHDIVRSYAQYVAREEALVASNSDTAILGRLNTQKFIWLSLETEGQDETHKLEWSSQSLQAQVSLRTVISVGNIKISPGDTLASFPYLRTLHVQDSNFDTLVDSLYKLKHLRYLSIHFTNTSRLPEKIGKMKFLQHISLNGCKSLSDLPGSITMLQQLRYLSLAGTSIKHIPRGFSGLTNLRQLIEFPAHMDGDWCSLEELEPLSLLRELGINGLENVSTSSFAKKARLGQKEHLSYLELACANRLGEEGIHENKQRQIEDVFDMLSPPINLENLGFKGYYGRRLPGWMMSTKVVLLKSLRTVSMHDLPCCTELPSGMYQQPRLEFLQISGAPAIKHVGLEFLQANHHGHHSHSQSGDAFFCLRQLNFIGMVELEEWEWEQQVKAMPFLEVLQLEKCKLRRLPPGLAFHASALRKLCVHNVGHLSSVENLSSVIELHVLQSPDLESISNLSKLQDLKIEECPKMKVLKGVPALYRLKLEDYDMETLPIYLQHVKPTHLVLECSKSLLLSVAAGKSSIEWDKFNHIKHVKAHIPRELYVQYTRDPFDFQTNISPSEVP
ncbi:unnamed protein product [Urochloa decumbens]|uniref:Uncharacterized protein n=1 Tax=Urochloa decumbens TaxID=240449 RepID=A0ABC9B7T8_9POAL